jgi:hypothetical protein
MDFPTNKIKVVLIKNKRVKVISVIFISIIFEFNLFSYKSNEMIVFKLKIKENYRFQENWIQRVIRLFVLFFHLVLFNNVYSQDSILQERTSFGGVPILSYDNDLGFRYGGVINYFKYDDSTFHYSENLFLRAFNTTNNSFQIQSVYETDHLIKKSKVFIEGSYLNDRSYDFLGFNGGESRVNQSHIDESHPDFIHHNYYKIHRELLRFRFDYQRYISSSRFRLLSGITMNRYIINLNDSLKSLYDDYLQHKLIDNEEENGGYLNYISLGLVYEKRDNQMYCSNGNWFESFVIVSPKLISESSFSKFILNWRIYRPFFKTKNILMFRTSIQTKMTGEVPSYFNSSFVDTRLNQDGVGGAFNLRGFTRNSIATSGFGLVNLEMRRNFISLKYKRTLIDVDLSLFSDQSIILQKFNLNKSHLPMTISNHYFHENHPYYYSSIGIGGYLILNKNSVVSINYGVPLGYNTFRGALYIGSSFLF